MAGMGMPMLIDGGNSEVSMKGEEKTQQCSGRWINRSVIDTVSPF